MQYRTGNRSKGLREGVYKAVKGTYIGEDVNNGREMKYLGADQVEVKVEVEEVKNGWMRQEVVSASHMTDSSW